jgi:hypothetical protein
MIILWILFYIVSLVVGFGCHYNIYEGHCCEFILYSFDERFNYGMKVRVHKNVR